MWPLLTHSQVEICILDKIWFRSSASSHLMRVETKSKFHTRVPVFTKNWNSPEYVCTVYPKKYAHGFVVLCFVVVMQSFIMNSHEIFIHIHQGYFAGTGAILRLPQCQWSKPDGYGKISHCITTKKHSKAKTVCKFLGIYCMHAFKNACVTNVLYDLTCSEYPCIKEEEP